MYRESFVGESLIQKEILVEREPNAVMTNTEEYLPRRVRMISLGDRYFFDLGV